ncbi:MAG: hypothetical protein DRG27_05290 [Deltaproteobacteria bacterium]|nr:MAG: hypothetical protein DRG27_05290 [Deltaproteobacteria bacterium]
MKDPVKGFFYALCGVILVSTNFVTAKYGLKGFDPETFTLIWTISATFYSFLICFFFKESRAQLFSPPYLKALLALGVLTGITMLLSWKGLSLLDPVFASLLWRFLPVITAIAGVIFFKEKLLREELFAIAIMVAGSFYSINGRWDAVGKGVFYIILATFAGAAQLLIAKAYSKKIDINVMVAYRVGIAAAFVFVWDIFFGKINISVPLRYWLVTMLGAFLGPCASFLFTFRSYRYWELSKASILLTLQPVFVLPFTYIFLGTLPDKKEIFGGAVILFGAIWLALIQARK